MQKSLYVTKVGWCCSCYCCRQSMLLEARAGVFKMKNMYGTCWDSPSHPYLFLGETGGTGSPHPENVDSLSWPRWRHGPVCTRDRALWSYNVFRVLNHRVDVLWGAAITDRKKTKVKSCQNLWLDLLSVDLMHPNHLALTFFIRKSYICQLWINICLKNLSLEK